MLDQLVTNRPSTLPAHPLVDRSAAPRADLRIYGALIPLAIALWVILARFSYTDLTIRARAAQLACFFASFAVFIIAVLIIWRLPRAPRGLLPFILITGALFRLTLAPIHPVTTWDIYRYLWEGRVINAGHNPFLEPPNSPALAPLRDWVWNHVEFKAVPAAYPPIAHYVFALADRIPADRISTFKLVFALLDIGTLLLLPGLLIALGRPPSWALLYAWHPLIVGEVVARGHFDSIGIFFMVLAIRLLVLAPSRSSRLLTGAALAASVLAKGYAIFLLPFFLIAARPRRLWLIAGFISLAVLAYLPFASAGMELLHGFRLYTHYWQGYASVFPLLDAALRRLTSDHTLLARRLCMTAFAIWLAYLIWRQRRLTSPDSALDSSFLALAGFFILSPVLYSWYLSWTVPFLCLRRRPAWLLLTGTIFAFYAHGFAGDHVEIWWLSALEYGLPLLLALALQHAAPTRSSARPPRA